MSILERAAQRLRAAAERPHSSIPPGAAPAPSSRLTASCGARAAVLAARLARRGAEHSSLPRCVRGAPVRRLRAEELCGLTAGPAQALSIQHTATPRGAGSLCAGCAGSIKPDPVYLPVNKVHTHERQQQLPPSSPCSDIPKPTCPPLCWRGRGCAGSFRWIPSASIWKACSTL